MVGVGQLTGLFGDPDLEEVLINGGRGMLRLYRNGRRESHPAPCSGGELMHLARSLAREAALRLDPGQPSTGGYLPDRRDPRGGWRWHVLAGAMVPEGPVFSLRRHRFTQLSPARFGLDEEALRLLESRLAAGQPLLICGGTGSGKTSCLASLLREFCLEHRVFIMEEVEEIPLASPVWVRCLVRGVNQEGRGGYTLGAMLRDSLRLRPDRLVIAEVRGGEAGILLQAMLCGHGSTWTTLHTDDPDHIPDRLGGGIDWPRHFDRLDPVALFPARKGPAALWFWQKGGFRRPLP